MNETALEQLARLWAGMGNAAMVSLRVTMILIAAWVISSVVQRAIRAFRERVLNRLDDPEAVKRAETLARMFRYIVKTVVWVLATMIVLGELGVSLAPILGAAGVVGLAVGFGAQSLVRDFFTGLTILLENQIRVGDVVNLGGQHAGVVEQITLRFVQLRDYEGLVHYVPNGQITSIINLTRGFANAVMDIGVAYRENTDEVMAVMREVARELRADETFSPRILDDLEIAGVDRWADSSVVIRCRFKCSPGEQWSVRREYLRRLKHAFDRAGIEIPYPHVTVYAGQDKQGRAPALPLQVQVQRGMRAGEATPGVQS